MQHGMIYVSLGLLPSANRPDDFQSPNGPAPDAQNRVGSFIGPMSASFQVNPPNAPVKGDLETAEIYGARVATITSQSVSQSEKRRLTKILKADSWEEWMRLYEDCISVPAVLVPGPCDAHFGFVGFSHNEHDCLIPGAGSSGAEPA